MKIQFIPLLSGLLLSTTAFADSTANKVFEANIGHVLKGRNSWDGGICSVKIPERRILNSGELGGYEIYYNFHRDLDKPTSHYLIHSADKFSKKTFQHKIAYNGVGHMAVFFFGEYDPNDLVISYDDFLQITQIETNTGGTDTLRCTFE